ncbi:MAG TPA: hypothetical protein GX008_08965 [Firmicutes bacterium]|jgi:Tfp pilus assembly protein PilN|nr:MAG: hypothetical protein AA931_03810 [Peptococcaceae bacterium 1109]HHT73831.1 hypothetical protein [Bacillota bacterium]
MRINLLPPDERPLKASAIRWEFVVGAVGLCLLALTIGLYFSEQAKVKHLDFQLDQWEKYQPVLQRQAQVVNDLRVELRNLEGQKSKLEGLMAPLGQVQQIDEALALIKGEVWAETATWTGNRVRLSGYAANMTELTSFVNILEAAGLKVNITAARPEDAGSFTTFTLEIEGRAGDELGRS